MSYHNIMDPLFNGMGGSEFYRSMVFPDLFPGRPVRLENWTKDDIELYVTGVRAGRSTYRPIRR